jgi:hypothetical protein
MFAIRPGTTRAASADDERVLSPYSGEDGVIDDEALYAALRARRVAHTPNVVTSRTVRLGELFLPDVKAAPGEDPAARNGWQSLYKGFQEIVEF